jgi:hypothetical protein
VDDPGAFVILALLAVDVLVAEIVAGSLGCFFAVARRMV